MFRFVSQRVKIVLSNSDSSRNEKSLKRCNVWNAFCVPVKCNKLSRNYNKLVNACSRIVNFARMQIVGYFWELLLSRQYRWKHRSGRANSQAKNFSILCMFYYPYVQAGYRQSFRNYKCVYINDFCFIPSGYRIGNPSSSLSLFYIVVNNKQRFIAIN